MINALRILRSRIPLLVPALLLAARPSPAQWIEHAPDPGECTIGVAAGRATPDGRPLLWKTRDASEEDNEVRFLDTEGFRYLAVVNAGGEVPWMAVNERGFALVNANSLDLEGTDNSGNGSFMRRAMITCATVAEFESLLDATNGGGRRTQAHFAVLDSTGAAALFETGGSRYWKFDAGDTLQTPEGYVVRTNFALNGGGTTGLTRYRRSSAIIRRLAAGDSLCVQGLLSAQLRDVADPSGVPYPIPYAGRYAPHVPVGYVPTSLSICRTGSVSAAIVEGVSPGETAHLTTLWAMLGQPAVAVLLPYWPVGPTPAEADGVQGAPLCHEAQRMESAVFRLLANPSGGGTTEYLDTYRLSDGHGRGVWHQLLPAEASLLADAQRMRAAWRASPPGAGAMLAGEARLASLGYAVLRSIEPLPPGGNKHTPEDFALLQNYPNPFNAGTRIAFGVPAPARVRISLYDILGRELRVLLDDHREAGTYEEGFDLSNLPSGFYLYRLYANPDGARSTTPQVVLSRKLVIVR